MATSLVPFWSGFSDGAADTASVPPSRHDNATTETAPLGVSLAVIFGSAAAFWIVVFAILQVL